MGVNMRILLEEVLEIDSRTKDVKIHMQAIVSPEILTKLLSKCDIQNCFEVTLND